MSGGPEPEAAASSAASFRILLRNSRTRLMHNKIPAIRICEDRCQHPPQNDFSSGNINAIFGSLATKYLAHDFASVSCLTDALIEQRYYFWHKIAIIPHPGQVFSSPSPQLPIHPSILNRHGQMQRAYSDEIDHLIRRKPSTRSEANRPLLGAKRRWSFLSTTT